MPDTFFKEIMQKSNPISLNDQRENDLKEQLHKMFVCWFDLVFINLKKRLNHQHIQQTTVRLAEDETVPNVFLNVKKDLHLVFFSF